MFSYCILLTSCLFITFDYAIANDRAKRQTFPKNLNFGSQQSANIGPLGRLLPDSNIGRSVNGNLNLARPNGGIGSDTNVFGLYQRQRGINNAGIRDGDNVGATWGDRTSLLGDRLGFGDQTDVNFNRQQGELGVQRQKGLTGIYTETDSTDVNPLGLQFNRQQKQCFGALFFGGQGICTNKNTGLNG